jgi:anti-sigma factor (TIGR02949 family)
MNLGRLINRRPAMRCSQAGKHLSPYIDGELETEEIIRLEAHLAKCDQCSGKLDEIKRLHGLFMQVERFSAPPGFRARVMERVNGQPEKVFSLYPYFARFVEAGVFLLIITAGIISGGMLTNAFAPHDKDAQVISSLSLEAFEALPHDSMGRAYLAVTEERR